MLSLTKLSKYTMVSQITSVLVVYSTVCSGADQRKQQSSSSLAFVRGIHRWPVNSLHKRPVTRKIFPFDDVNMVYPTIVWWQLDGCNGGGKCGKCISLYWFRSGTWDSKHVLVPHLRRLSSNLVTTTVANNHRAGDRPSWRLLKVRLKLVIEKPFIYHFYLFFTKSNSDNWRYRLPFVILMFHPWPAVVSAGLGYMQYFATLDRVIRGPSLNIWIYIYIFFFRFVYCHKTYSDTYRLYQVHKIQYDTGNIRNKSNSNIFINHTLFLLLDHWKGKNIWNIVNIYIYIYIYPWFSARLQ